MLGAVIGEIADSRFKRHNPESKDFELLTDECYACEKTVLTFACGKAVMDSINFRGTGDKEDRMGEFATQYMCEFALKYPNCAYNDSFRFWAKSDLHRPYQMYEIEAAVRVSAAGLAAETLQEATDFADAITRVTHNYFAAKRGAEAVSVAIFLAKSGASKEEIRNEIDEYYYSLDFTIDSIWDTNTFYAKCDGPVPAAIECFLESTSFEDAIRIAISLGSDCSAVAVITGAIAQAHYGIPEAIEQKALSYLSKELRTIYYEWTDFIENKCLPENAILDGLSPSDPLLAMYPPQEELKEDVEKLRTELSMLVLERDAMMYQECKTIEMQYKLAVGALEYQAYEIECAILRLKRKVELIQMKKNRQEKVILSAIEEVLDVEQAEYRSRLLEQMEQMNTALSRSKMKSMDEKDSHELKKLYRLISKALHPDVHPNLPREKMELFQNAILAYENGDLIHMRIIADMVASPTLPENLPASSGYWTEEKERLTLMIQSFVSQIAAIKSEYPYTLKSLVQDSAAMEDLKAQLQNTIDNGKETLAAYSAKIEDMLR
jgi:ADP-ribosylglycohydrolase